MKTSLVLLLLLCSAVTIFGANTEAHATAHSTSCSATQRAEVQFGYLWSKDTLQSKKKDSDLVEDEKRYFLNDLLVILIGYDRKVAQTCASSLQIEMTGEDRNLHSTITRDAKLLTEAERTLILGDYEADYPFQAFAYRVKKGDNAKSLANAKLFKNSCTSCLFASDATTDVSQAITPSGIKINTTPARLVQITTRKAAATYTYNPTNPEVIDIALIFDKAVILDKTAKPMRLELNSGAFATFQGYDVAYKHQFHTLIFRYIVGPGEETTALDVKNIEYNDNVIVTADSMLPATITIPAAASYNSLPQAKIVISKQGALMGSGARLPPHDYNPMMSPTPATAVVVNVSPQYYSIWDVNERANTFQASITQRYYWTDSRFAGKICKDTGATPCTDTSYSVELPYEEYKDKIWNPELIPHNTVQNVSHPIFDAVHNTRLSIQNNGVVTVLRTYVNTFDFPQDYREFPYEFVKMTVQFRSKFNKNVVQLRNDDDYSQHMEKAIKALNDPTFHFYKFKTAVIDVATGYGSNYQVHTTEVQAHRRAVNANMLIVFPIVFLLGVLFCTYFLPIAGEARFIVTGIVMCGNLVLNYTVLSFLPQTGYASRIGILMMFNYIWILYTFLWHAITRIAYHGVDALLAKLRIYELDNTVNKAQFPVNTDKCPQYTARVGYSGKMDVDLCNLPARLAHVHIVDLVGRSLFFIFTVISTCVVLARYIH
jgi:hypothetical protein